MKVKRIIAGIVFVLLFALPSVAQELPEIDKPNAFVFDALAVPGRAKDYIKIKNSSGDANFNVCVYVYDKIYSQWLPAGSVLIKKPDDTFEIDSNVPIKKYQFFAVESMNGKKYQYGISKKNDDLYITVFPASANGNAQSSSSKRKSSSASSLDAAVVQVAEYFAQDIKEGQKIAVLSISGRNADERDFVLEELSYQLVETRRFSVVDRRSLDTIRREQQFQLSGEVSDDSAVSIGQLLGAEVVITGSISGTDSLRRLRVKALDVKTGEIVAMESIRF